MAYQVFFALIPLLALVIGAFSLISGPDRAAGQLTSLIRQVYPAARQEETVLRILGGAHEEPYSSTPWWKRSNG